MNTQILGLWKRQMSNMQQFDHGGIPLTLLMKLDFRS
jgi:hypothetical protein